MASIKVKFRSSSVSVNEGSVYYQIIHDRKVRRVNTDIRLLNSEWDEKRSAIAMDVNSDRRSVVQSARDRILLDIENLERIDRMLASRKDSYNVDDIIAQFRVCSSSLSMFGFIRSLISAMVRNGRSRTSETYAAALNSFRKYRKGSDIMLDQVDSEIMEAYESWLRNQNISPNTISFYTRILRAAYNRAVDRGITVDRQPFRRVYTGVEKTAKRALPIQSVKEIKNMRLMLDPALDYARDMFMMSFYLRGMSFIDMAYLKKTNLKRGVVTYRRRKTGQQLSVKWTREMQAILDKYPANETDYLLPIIRKKRNDARTSYRNAGYNINHSLKRIGEILGIEIPLTLYVARHSWASAAKAKGIPLSVISEGMGHDSESTTRIYLASLDTEVVDSANSLILDSLK